MIRRGPRSFDVGTSVDDQLTRFVEALFEPTDIVEIRRLPSRRSTSCRASELPSLAATLQAENDAGQNIYIGANPRTRKGGTKAEDVAICRSLVADFDNVTVDEARTAWENAGLRSPTVVVNTGHGVHAYWRLSEPMTPENWTASQKDLIAAVGSDPAIHDPPRIVRLPGFTNHKVPVATSCLIDADPSRVYDLASLEKCIPHRKPEQIAAKNTGDKDAQSTDLNVLARAAAYLDKVPGAVEGSNGDDHTYRTACKLVNDFNLSVDQTFLLMAEWNQRCNPPWPENELREKIKNAAKYCKEPPGSKLNEPLQCPTSDKLVYARNESSAVSLPQVILPGGEVSISEAAMKLGRLLAATTYFVRGGVVVTVDHDDEGAPILRPVKPATLPSAFETVARLFKLRRRDGDPSLKPAICSEHMAKVILHSQHFVAELPVIRMVTRCPVLIERNGQLVQITCYDPPWEILAAGKPAPEILIEEARQLLDDLVADFRFATPADRARALAAIITPALVLGGLLGGRAPVDLGEADASQSGKGYRNKITAAIYNQKVRTITQRKGGVGSLEEAFNAALVRGANFICLDNMRGKIDLPAIESFLTEDVYSARIPYSPDMEIDPRRVMVMMTSNKAEITLDLANRSSCVLILRQPEGYQFSKHPEGDILDHVRANAEKYLGAVFSVVRAWHAVGKPKTNESRHDFRPWVRILDWISQKLLEAGPIMAGHRDTQERMSNPALTWLRDVALAVAKAGELDRSLRAYQLLDIIADAPDVEVPGLADDADPSDEVTRNKLLLALGRKLGRCFRENIAVIDAYRIERFTSTDAHGRSLREYRFSAISRHATTMSPPSKTGFPPSPAIPAIDSELSKGNCGMEYSQYGTNGGDAGKRVSDGGEASDDSGELLRVLANNGNDHTSPPADAASEGCVATDGEYEPDYQLWFTTDATERDKEVIRAIAAIERPEAEGSPRQRGLANESMPAGKSVEGWVDYCETEC